MKYTIKLVIFDFDGVFTDGKFYFNNNGITSKCYNAKDCYSLKLLKKNNIKTGIISGDEVISLKNAKHIYHRVDKISTGQSNKLTIFKEWINEFNLHSGEVAYIGDDIPDIDILNYVKISGCPANAIDNVKNICSYVCKNNGGDGAVREFVEYILKYNKSININKNNSYIYRSNEITAVIPVRKGSTRCKNKNIRDFGDTNLLKLKIETLKKIKSINRILVTSNCNIMLQIAMDLGVETHKRDDKYCTNKDAHLFFEHLGSIVETEFFIYSPCTTPFINVETIDAAINEFKNMDDKYDSLNSVNIIKEYLWYNNKSINYNQSKHISSQLLPEYKSLNFCFNIMRTSDVIKYKNIIGINPKFVICDSISGIDIDYPNDFIKSELLYQNDIISGTDTDIILELRDRNKIELLDCTIRDGGYINNWEFTDEEVLECYKAVSEAGYDYFEIGFKTNKELLPNKGKWCYCNEEYINNIVNNYRGCKIAVMAKMNTFKITDFVNKNESNINLVRVLIAKCTIKDNTTYSYYNEEDIIQAKNMCNKLIKLGYEITINLACGDLIEKYEIDLICKHFYDINLKAIYLADTYGGFNEVNLPKLLHNFYRKLNEYKSIIPFGFHSHNNNQNALSKTKIAMFHGCRIVDSCIGGLGRGSGNLKTELLILELSKNYNKHLNIIPIIEYSDKYILKINDYKKQQLMYGYNIYYAIAGYLSLHPNYILEIINNYSYLPSTKIYELILKLDKYTKESNRRNYDKMLIKNII